MKQVPEARLAIVGDGPHRSFLERKFADVDAVFHGYLKGEQLASAYASADAFVYASETETMGNVILEAMAAGAPVVAPRAGGIPSLVTHERTGYLFEPGDVNAAATFVNNLLNDSILRSAISRAARQTVEETGWRQSIACVRECYVQTVAAAVSQPSSRFRKRSRAASAAVTGLVTAFRAVSRGGNVRRQSARRESARRGQSTSSALSRSTATTVTAIDTATDTIPIST